MTVFLTDGKVTKIVTARPWNIARTHCTDFARNCTPFRALFCVQMPIVGKL